MSILDYNGPTVIIKNKNKMQLEKVRAAFERKGFTPNAYIDKKDYYRVLNSLAVLRLLSTGWRRVS